MNSDSKGPDPAKLSRWFGLLGLGCLLFVALTATNKGNAPITDLAFLMLLPTGAFGIVTYAARRREGPPVGIFWLILPILLLVAFFWILLLGGIIRFLVSILVP